MVCPGKMSNMHLRRMYILFWGRVFCLCLLDLSCLLCYSSLLYFLGYLLSGYSVFENEVLKSSTVIVELFIASVLSIFASYILMVCHLVHKCL